MELAINEAKQSLREGNKGFGAVIVKNDKLIGKAHDTEITENDATAHAEIKVIQSAAKILGKELTGCVLISTHEPCPMCATACAWSNISKIVYGFSIQDAKKQGRNRIDITCDELFARANKDIVIERGCMQDQCSLLYNKMIRREIKRLRNATEDDLAKYNRASAKKRVEWFKAKTPSSAVGAHDKLEAAYHLLLARFKTTPSHVPVVKKTAREIVFHSMNFCPTLEACIILGLDTRKICKPYNEQSTDSLIKQIDPCLKFKRNYKKLRPYSQYCQESISIIE